MWDEGGSSSTRFSKHWIILWDCVVSFVLPFLSFSFPCSFLPWLCSFLSISYFPVLLSSFPSFFPSNCPVLSSFFFGTLAFCLKWNYFLDSRQVLRKVLLSSTFQYHAKKSWDVLGRSWLLGAGMILSEAMDSRWIQGWSWITPTPTLHG